MASLYLVPAAEFADGVARGVVRIVGDEARHAAQVSRVRVGEHLSVGDGSGSIASGAVEQVTPGEVLVRMEFQKGEGGDAGGWIDDEDEPSTSAKRGAPSSPQAPDAKRRKEGCAIC